MPWWGGGNSEDTSSPQTETFVDDSAGLTGGGAMDLSGGGMDLGGGGGGMPAAGVISDIQSFSQELSQQMVIQAVIGQITQTAFEKCISKPRDNKLTGTEVACVHSTANKFVDTNEFMLGRLAKKGQQTLGQ